MADSAASLIDEKGGPAAVASVLGLPPGVVRAWKHRNSIPRKAWPELQTAFSDITLERLMALENREPAEARP